MAKVDTPVDATEGNCKCSQAKVYCSGIQVTEKVYKETEIKL